MRYEHMCTTMDVHMYAHESRTRPAHRSCHAHNADVLVLVHIECVRVVRVHHIFHVKRLARQVLSADARHLCGRVIEYLLELDAPQWAL